MIEIMNGEVINSVRGRCKELAEEAVAKDPSLTLVRGWYYDYIWDQYEQHWWTKRKDGTICDPSCSQFPTNGFGIYEEFTGTVICEECGEVVEFERCYHFGGNHFACSSSCAKKLLGLR